MRNIYRLVAAVVVLAALLALATPVLAAEPEKVPCIVQPVIGGPANPGIHNSNGSVSIPVDNPAIRWGDELPGLVFLPVPPE